MTEPAETPVTFPEASIVARDVFELLHVPPAVASVSEMIDPTQTLVLPDIAAGKGFTVTVITDIQPVAVILYVIVAVPAETPVTTPVVATTVAMVVLLLVHEPPVVASDRRVVEPTHTDATPVIDAGNGFTVIEIVLRQPVGNV